jgi:hypothetical protein
MMLRLSASVKLAQEAISEIVRPQPSQTLVTGSITQILLQGEIMQPMPL